MMHHMHNSYTVNDPSNASWTPELMLSMKGTFERQYARDKLIDMLYNDHRRVRKAVPGPAEGYYHPNEINGVRLHRKGPGIPPTHNEPGHLNNKEVLPRRGKGLPRLGQSPIFSHDRRILANSAQVPEEALEQMWPSKGKRIVPGPAEGQEQLWPCKGKRIVQGRSHVDHDVQTLLAWNPGADSTVLQPSAALLPTVQAPKQEKIGKRCHPEACKSSIVFG